MKFKAIGRTLAGAALAASVAIPVAAPQAVAAGTVNGCPSGYVCIYEGQSWSKIRNMYAKYGTQPIYNYGDRIYRVFNNQTGGAMATVCIDTGGVYCGGTMYAGHYYDVNLLHFNSVKLWPKEPIGTR